MRNAAGFNRFSEKKKKESFRSRGMLLAVNTLARFALESLSISVYRSSPVAARHSRLLYYICFLLHPSRASQ